VCKCSECVCVFVCVCACVCMCVFVWELSVRVCVRVPTENDVRTTDETHTGDWRPAKSQHSRFPH
jgi:hypothetical protein